VYYKQPGEGGYICYSEGKKAAILQQQQQHNGLNAHKGLATLKTCSTYPLQWRMPWLRGHKVVVLSAHKVNQVPYTSGVAARKHKLNRVCFYEFRINLVYLVYNDEHIVPNRSRVYFRIAYI
jgi:hypothetical protein